MFTLPTAHYPCDGNCAEYSECESITYPADQLRRFDCPEFKIHGWFCMECEDDHLRELVLEKLPGDDERGCLDIVYECKGRTLEDYLKSNSD